MQLGQKEKEELIFRAMRARERAYAPYSQFKVGAALITDEGNIVTGCNVENSAYGLCNCAERTAVFSAVSEYGGSIKISGIAIVGWRDSDEPGYAFPCGSCRQVLSEFEDKKQGMQVLVARNVKDYKEYQLKELLPGAFSLGEDEEE